jgi:hypothetical protein
VAGVEQLTGFQDHFDDVFITVILGTLAGIPMEEEDVHFKILTLSCSLLNSFWWVLGQGQGQETEQGRGQV